MFIALDYRQKWKIRRIDMLKCIDLTFHLYEVHQLWGETLFYKHPIPPGLELRFDGRNLNMNNGIRFQVSLIQN